MAIVFNKPIVCPILIGRTLELRALHSLIDQVKVGQGQVVLVSGEAGIGKSRLMAETNAYATAKDFLLLQGNCFQADLSNSYAPLLDLLQSSAASQLAATIASDLAPFARELHQLVPDIVPLPPNLAPLSAFDPEQEKHRLFTALAHFFTGQITKQPVLLVIEDMHWSDDTSLEFLHYLARRCPAHSLLILLTYRSDEVRPGLRHFLAQLDRERLAQEIPLASLTRSEVEAMLRAIFALPHSARLELPDLIYTLTEGNPFFVEEILKSLIATGEIFYANGRWERKSLGELHIPRSVQDAVQQRTARLSEGARRVLILAAVAGRRFDFALLQHLTHFDEDQVLQSIKELIAAQLVVEESEERFAFRHALTRQAVYADLLVRERKALHRSMAKTMERLYAPALDAHEAQLADLAYHFYEAGAWEQALAYAQRAGEQAQAMYAPRAAIEQLTRALDATHHLGRTVPPKLYQTRGQAYETVGEFEQARSDYERALEIARSVHDQSAEWESLISLGFLWAGRDYTRTGTYYQQALKLARSMGDPLTLAHSLNRMGNWWLNTGQVAEAIAAHEEALALFEGQQHRSGMAETLDLLGMTHGISGNAVGAVIQYSRAIDLFRALGDSRGLASSLPVRSLLASPAQAEPVATLHWDLAPCERDATESLSLCQQIEWVSGEAYTEICLGLLLACFGHFGRGLAHAQRGLRIATEIDHQQWIAGAHCYVGQIYVLMLAPQEALQHLEVGGALARQLGSAWWVGNIVAYRALAYLLQGERERAEAELQAVISPVQHPHTLPERRLLWVWSELALAQGKPQACLDGVDRLLQSAPQSEVGIEGQPIPWLLKCKGDALSALKRLEEAVQVLEEAQRGALLRQEPPLLWQIQRTLGHVYRLLRREEEAKRAYDLARDTITSLAQTIDDPDLHAHFMEAALLSLPREKPLSPRRVASQQFGGLTERERTIAALVAQGHTNRAIAEQLVLSERTVEGHVTNILTKLGCTTRTQIAKWAVEKGLARRDE